MRRAHVTTALVATLLVAAVIGPAVVAPPAAGIADDTVADGSADGPPVGQVAVEVGTENDSDGWRLSAEADELVVSGRSNRENGTTVFVDLLRPDGRAARSAAATVSNGTWNTTLDVAGLAPGSYTLRVSDGETARSVPVAFVVTPTPAETPFVPPTTTATPTPVPTATPATPTASIPSPVPTLATSPGFGVLSVVAALVCVAGAVALLARRRG
jgi:hypothetical protein